MNIAIFTDTFLPNINGIVTLVIDSAKGLAERGHKVLIIAPRAKKGYSVDMGKNISVRFISSVKAYFYEGFRFTFPSTLKLIRLLKEFKADVIHLHTQFTLGVEALVCAKIMHKPLVGTFNTFIAEPGYLKHMKLDKIKPVQKIAWIYSNFFYNRCNIVISPSKATKSVLKKEGVKKKIKVIPYALDLSKFRRFSRREIESAKKNYGINDKTVLFVGRISHEKSVDTLIEAMKLVAKDVPDSKLLIIGGGPLLSRLKKQYSAKNIRFTGMIKNSKLVDSAIIPSCSVFATMSKTDNQPLAILEAMAFGLPVIGVDRLGVPEMVDKNGFIAPADNCKVFASYMIKLLEDKNLRKAYGQRSMELVKRFSLDKVTEDMEKAYLSAIRDYSK
ncbi:glycosyltransferase [Candidatus Woesearchaeota archaeon]|nr:glycosyltransferase [Candidatus Woesearchaeota archaeon]